MKIETCTGYPDDLLERYRPGDADLDWELVTSGFWSNSHYNSGYISYRLARREDGVWIMDGERRSAELDGVTEEDIAEENLNDDQLQALWGTTLEEAQSASYNRIVAICIDAPQDAQSHEIAELLYDAIEEAGGTIVEEPDGFGILDG
jgi:hypothetical protein